MEFKIMENNSFVEVMEDFEMVKPGDVYPSTIKKGEHVQGRIAEVALELEKGILHDPDAEAEKARKEAEADKEAQKTAQDDQGSLLQTPGAIPESKVSPEGETKDSNAESGAAK